LKTQNAVHLSWIQIARTLAQEKKKEKEEDSNEKAKSKVERTVCYKI
jgi:SOS response regulatory protein OraA/RecX